MAIPFLPILFVVKIPYRTVVMTGGFFDYLLSQIRLSATAQNDRFLYRPIRTFARFAFHKMNFGKFLLQRLFQRLDDDIFR